MFKFFFIVAFIFAGINSGAQTLTFCTAIDKEGQCRNKPKHFYIEQGKGGYVYAVVNLLEEVNTVKVKYEIFRITNYLDEVYMTTLTQDVLPGWKSFYKQIIFPTELNYKIYVYTDSGKLLTSNGIFVEADYEY